MNDDLMAQLASLTPEAMEQNELRASRRKAPWVKVFNEFEADTTFSEGVARDGKTRILVLKWANMTVFDSDTPWTGTEDEDEFPISERANSKLGFLVKSCKEVTGKDLTALNGQRVRYKLGLWQQKNADGSVRLNDKGFPAYELWYWDVVSVGKGAGAKADKPEMSDEEFDAALGKVVGLSHAEAMKEVGGDVISKGLLKKRIKQVEGVYVEASA